MFTKICKKGTLIEETQVKTDGLGVNIDLFPIDSVFSYESAKKINRKIYLIKILINIKTSRKKLSSLKGITKYLFSLLLAPIKLGFFHKMANHLLNKEFTPNSDWVANMTRDCDERGIIRSRIFNNFVDVEFEGKKYKAPVGYDEWQRVRYGDYMELPPEEKRVTHHSFTAYYK